MKIPFCYYVFNVLLFIFYPLIQVKGQAIEKVNYIPKTPEVAYFERYGDIPVDEYMGAHSTSINLYQIKNKDIDFPLNLQYNSGGIQVSQEATWVGLESKYVG